MQVDARYINLKPIGRGAYGLVASADDALTGRKVRRRTVRKIAKGIGFQYYLCSSVFPKWVVRTYAQFI